MTVPQGASLYTQGFGSRPEDVEIPHYDTRSPAPTDVGFPLGKSWINTASNLVFILTSFSSSLGAVSATWLNLGTSSSDVTGLSGNTGVATPTAGIIAIVGSGLVSVAAAGSTLTISATIPPTFTWNNNSTSQAMTSNNGYIITAGAQTFTLPVSSVVGDEIELMLNGGTSWTVTLGGGKQVLDLNNAYATSVASNSADVNGTVMRIICTTANTTWRVDSLIGTLIGT
jgi:hypothetical protein